MDIEKIFEFLTKDYGFRYSYQVFQNCYDLGYTVYTHSFYNDNGCFTIHALPARSELDFYYAPQFSKNRKNLCVKLVNIRSIEEEIWNKHTKILGITNPFFWLSDKKVLTTLAEALKSHIAKHGEFFGIKLENEKK